MRKVALITGGARGIGLGISRALAADGFALAAAGTREEDAVKDVVEHLRADGTEALYCQADVSDADARQRMLDRVREHYGRLDVLVNNAGVAPKVRADILDASEESFDRLININLKGPYFLTQAVANWMIEQKQADEAFDGCIINISSISARVASVSRGDYCLSKAGVAMASQLWAVRLADHDIPVYEVRPGLIKTDMTAAVTSKYDKLIEDGLCLTKRWGTPDDVGKCVAALARGDMPYATGQVIYIDGGMMVDRL